jgi:hypothetical protein
VDGFGIGSGSALCIVFAIRFWIMSSGTALYRRRVSATARFLPASKNKGMSILKATEGADEMIFCTTGNWKRAKNKIRQNQIIMKKPLAFDFLREYIPPGSGTWELNSFSYVELGSNLCGRVNCY